MPCASRISLLRTGPASASSRDRNAADQLVPFPPAGASSSTKYNDCSHSSGIPLLFKSTESPAARSHSSGTPLRLQSCDVPAAMSHESAIPLLLQSSQLSGMPLWLQSAHSHSSGTPFPLQSRLVPAWMSWASGIPLLLQSNVPGSINSMSSM